jgi:hypothetical protein
MKISHTLQITATLILGLGPVIGHAQTQTYYYSGPISAWSELDLSPAGLGYDSPGYEITFGTLTETLYYNPVAQTLEQVGSVTVSPASVSFNIEGSIFTPGESGSATLTVGNNGTVSFDNTIAGFAFGSGAEGWAFSVPVSGSGIYNGQAFSGGWNIYFELFTEPVAVSPTSLTFTETSLGSLDDQGSYVIPGTDLKDAVSDGTYSYSWQQEDAVATAVPEASSPALLGLGLSALAFMRRR